METPTPRTGDSALESVVGPPDKSGIDGSPSLLAGRPGFTFTAPRADVVATATGAELRALAGAASAPLAIAMVLAIVVVALLGFWDARKESGAALADFAGEQATLAQGVAAAVSRRVAAFGDAASTQSTFDLLSDVRALERPSSLRLLLARPGQKGFGTIDERLIRDYGMERALADGTSWVRLERNEAPAFGLPMRTAVAGIAAFDGPRGRWGVAIVATALRERDRELRAQWRSVVGVLVGSGLVLLFGGYAMRKQRKELEVSRELTVADLTREREQQLVQIDKLATMAALATGIAHEVSTPLGVIVGRAESLLPKLGGEERARRAVESIIEQGTRINRVVRGFLDLARGESPPLEHVEPGAVADAARRLVEHRFEQAGVHLGLTIDPKLPRVACDPPLLEQAIINLLLNACDACESGGRVDLVVCADSGRVGFVVTDDGEGITKEAAARAAEPFFTTKPAGRGTGLGLAIASEIVKHHGGQLSIGPRSTSTEAGRGIRGTRASVDLPALKVPA